MVSYPYAYTRRLFEPEEVIISICNSCFATVGESDDDSVLEDLERYHCCKPLPKAVAMEQDLDSELLIAV